MGTDALNVSYRLRQTATVLAAILVFKVLGSILYEYRWYFPANFDSLFLNGRRESFVGIYRTAFYTHIISSPIALVLAGLLVASGGRPRFRTAHRWAGRTQIILVLAAVVPSGLIMATGAYAGVIAGCGFATLSLLTGSAAGLAVWHAMGKRFDQHQRWAIRCGLLLASALLLRLLSGLAVVMHWDPEWAYRFSAWLSWLIPLAAFELGWRIHGAMKLPNGYNASRL